MSSVLPDAVRGSALTHFPHNFFSVSLVLDFQAMTDLHLGNKYLKHCDTARKQNLQREIIHSSAILGSVFIKSIVSSKTYTQPATE